jgi:hypothetical protein
MSISTENKRYSGPPPYWGVTSFSVPFVSLLIALLVVAGVSKGVGGDMAGGGMMFYCSIAVGAAGIFGLVASAISMAKEERWMVLAVCGIILNLPLVVAGGLGLWKLLKL